MDAAWVAPRFQEQVSNQVRAIAVDVLQVNVGYRCNLECRHCHVNAGPRRREVMPAEVMEQCVKVFSAHSIDTLDITGGSPELHPRLPWLLDRCAALGRRLMVRTNGVILLEKGYETFTPGTAWWLCSPSRTWSPAPRSGREARGYFPD
jgi:MoaA/NifB/PqqE/SkfB family radical SAM enzyme